MKANFQRGSAGRYSPQDMVRARVFTNCPLRGGIRPRSAPVRNLIIHSTETARVADAKTVVKSWNHGLSHPGTQYVVDRDGKIFQTVDPRFATIHVNEKRTLGGVTNDNSIGIEIVRTGKQKYTQVQLAALVQLVDYIQERFPIAKIYGHGQVQPSNRTDPVAFNWSLFSQNLALINSSSTQTAYSSDVDDDSQG
jgi:N-acetyl-anhydromuramyl-L-alanine amidase AmpD